MSLGGRTEEEINGALALLWDWSGWECFSHEGRAYASWFCAPRYFQPEEHPEQWQAIRKYLVRVRAFLGGGAVYVGNDLLSPPTPEEGEPFFLPLRVPDAWLAEPDLHSRPELAQVKELEGLS